MHPSVLSWWPLLLAATAAGPAGAQPDPSQVSPPAYRSALEGYQKFDEQPVAAWKDANATVGRIGGWKAYAQEASGQTQPAEAPAPAQANSGGQPAQPAPMDPRGNGHNGHHR